MQRYVPQIWKLNQRFFTEGHVFIFVSTLFNVLVETAGCTVTG